MAVNLAEKYSAKVAERFKLKSLTEAFVNHNYEWSGVETVKVYSIPTVALNDYTRSGMSRYGTPTELQDTIQEMKVTQDKAFTFTIDKGNNQDQYNVKDAGKALAREIDEVIIPTKDKYRMDKIVRSAVTAGGTNTTPTATTKTTAYEAFVTGNAYLDNQNVPTSGRIAGITASFYSKLRLDPSFVKNGDLGQKIAINGQVGEVDGVKIVRLPDSYLPEGCSFVITHPSVTVAADKLADYKIHKDPVGINGNVVEGRVRYDAFVLDAKKTGIYAYREKALTAPTTTPTTPSTGEDGE